MEQAVKQLVKGAEIAMSKAVLLTSENEKLQMENKRQKRKRVQRRMYIAKGGILTGSEGASLAHAASEGGAESAAAPAAAPATAATEQLQRAPRKCSMCTSTEHTARTCPRRQATS
jgi:hypothetical protein